MADLGGADAAFLWPEDTVEYLIYCQAPRKLEDQDDALSKLALECNHASRLLSVAHVWHFSAFALRPGEKIEFIRPLDSSWGFFTTHLSPCQSSGPKSHANKTIPAKVGVQIVCCKMQSHHSEVGRSTMAPCTSITNYWFTWCWLHLVFIFSLICSLTPTFSWEDLLQREHTGWVVCSGAPDCSE